MENLDHDFPLAPRMLLSLSGVVVCKDKNSQQTFHPSAMHAFVRPIRYYPTSATTNMHDLMQTLMDEFGTPTNNTIDVLLVGSDNGPDYSMEVSLVQHILGRIWRERGLAWSALGAHAPYHSAYHWEIEQQWSKAKRKLVGQQLGRNAVNDDKNPFHGFENTELALKAITNSAVRTFSDLMSRCETQGNRWNVSTPLAEDLLADAKDILAYYASSAKACKEDRFAKVRAEALDFGMHMSKIPSFLQFRMCVTNSPCAMCKEVIARRRICNPEWHPAHILAPLRKNNYWLFHSENKDAAPSNQPSASADTTSFSARAQYVSAEDAMPKNAASPYKSMDELIETGCPQGDILIPVNKDKIQLECVLTCKESHCRYVAKTQTEMKRHLTHHHGSPVHVPSEEHEPAPHNKRCSIS